MGALRATVQKVRDEKRGFESGFSMGGDAPVLKADAQAAVSRCGVHVVRLASSAAQGDCQHCVKLAASHEFVRHGPCAIMIRPDKFVYGMAKLSDANDLIAQFEQYLT